jgi:hypothetical protein
MALKPLLPTFALLLLVSATLSACAEHADPTTLAISAADQTGGICSAESNALSASINAPVYDCEDRSMSGISDLVFNTQD